MGKFNVIHRTKDGMFNATDLLRQWNTSSGEKKEIYKFFDNENTRQFVEALILEENLNTQNSAYLKSRGKNSTRLKVLRFSKWVDKITGVEISNSSAALDIISKKTSSVKSASFSKIVLISAPV